VHIASRVALMFPRPSVPLVQKKCDQAFARDVVAIQRWFAPLQPSAQTRTHLSKVAKQVAGTACSDRRTPACVGLLAAAGKVRHFTAKTVAGRGLIATRRRLLKSRRDLASLVVAPTKVSL